MNASSRARGGFSSKIVELSKIEEEIKSQRADGSSVVLCHGVFDLLHIGHLRHFAQAKKLGDILVVSITSDTFVNKGPGRPAFNEQLRAEALSNLEIVDFVLISRDSTGIPAISTVKPNYYVKGGEYFDEATDATGNIARERLEVELHGGEVHFTDEIIFSSSALINTYLPSQPPEITNWLLSLKNKYSSGSAIEWLNRISNLKVVIIGEAIIDVYSQCDALGKSSKDPILCFSRGLSESHAGGVLAIAGHCAGLGMHTTVITGINKVDEFGPELEQLRKRGVDVRTVDLGNKPTIRKERYIDHRTGVRVLELYEMDDSELDESIEIEIRSKLAESVENADLIIVADYGHGFISNETIDYLTDLRQFLAINVQSNAGNKGLNSVNRYSRADFLTLNGTELRHEAKRRNVELREFVPMLQKRLSAQKILVTLGGDGVDVFDSESNVTHAPAFAPFVRDRVGAGDALLSVTAPLAMLDAPSEIIGLFGNSVGAWAVSFLGNQETIDKGKLSRQIGALIK